MKIFNYTAFILLIVFTTLWLSGCGIMGAAARYEYNNYVAHTRALGKEPMSEHAYWQWAAPRCGDRNCDRSKLVDKEYERKEGKENNPLDYLW